MKDSDIIALGLECGFTLATNRGQQVNKLMPITDASTLLEFARRLLTGQKPLSSLPKRPSPSGDSLYRTKALLVKAEQWFPGKQIDGVLRIPGGKVDASKTRGIVFDRPERHVINCFGMQVELAPGDYVVQSLVGMFKVSPLDFELLYEPDR